MSRTHGVTDTVLPFPKDPGSVGSWQVRDVAPPLLFARMSRSPLGLFPMFGSADVLRTRIRGTNWFFGRTPEWTRQVGGAHMLWADIDILPLGLGTDPTYYAMGGLPGAPPELHTRARRTAIGAGFRQRELQAEHVMAAHTLAIRLACDKQPSTTLDLRTYARALCLHATASVVCGITLNGPEISRVLGWFDRWSATVSNPLIFIVPRGTPGSPARRFRRVLGEWHGFLHALVVDRVPDGGLAEALRNQVARGEITVEEAVGYLATILFAGTEPPSHTLLWCATHVAAGGPRAWRALTPERARELMWESFRVQPAVNVVVRRLAERSRPYTSASDDVFVLLPPLAHRFSNEVRGLPATFTPELAGTTTLPPADYPGLGIGAHRCIGAAFGMQLGSDALRFLTGTTILRQPGNATPRGQVIAEPRQLPTVSLPPGGTDQVVTDGGGVERQ